MRFAYLELHWLTDIDSLYYSAMVQVINRPGTVYMYNIVNIQEK